MLLMVMRHGPAEESSRTGRDFDRVLTESGRRRTARVAEELVRRAPAPERILSSPLARALETAEILRGAFGVTTAPEIRPELAPAEDALSLVAELRQSPVESALLVSHSPDVSFLCGRLIEAESRGFEAAMIVALDIREDGATERFVIVPSELLG